ncbi:MAG: HNH endonuclease [Cellulomonadaceae bacterium]
MELLTDTPGLVAGDPQPLSAAEIEAFRARLLAAPAPAAEAEQVEVLSALEDLRSAEVGARGVVVLALDHTVRIREAGAGVGQDTQGAGVARQIGLATRRSPWSAGVFLGMSRVLGTEMPHTGAALRAGRLNEERALALVRETACLPREARAEVDRRLCADPGTLAGQGTKRIAGRARALAAELDPAAVVARNSRSVASAGVWLRPAVDGMSYLTALVPLGQGVGMFAALTQAADLAPAGRDGDARPRGQVMADTLVARVLGRERAEEVAVTVNLVLSDQTLLGAGHEPAIVLDEAGAGYGCVPAQIARTLVANAIDADAAWLRRIYAGPEGDLVSASSRSRFFAAGLAAMLRVRDQGICRTPYCDAPVRHLDHVTPVREGGPTTARNGQGLCQACNQAKEAPGWSARADTDPRSGRHRVTTTAPTGHTVVDRAPPLPRPAAHRRACTHADPNSTVELFLADVAWPAAA